MSEFPSVNVRRFSRSKRVDDEPTQEAPTPEQPEEAPSAPPSSPIMTTGAGSGGGGFLDDLKHGNIPQDFIAPPKLKRQSNNNKSSTEDFDLMGMMTGSLAPEPEKPTPKKGGKKGKNNKTAEFSDLFDSENPSEILGKERRELLTRAKEYKVLFPDELASFKLKEKASNEELETAIGEMDLIVSCQGVQSLLNEGFYTGVQVLETISSKSTKLDITGTTEALRHNPEVLKLLKLIWIKYRVFGSAPPEVQLLITTLSTAMVMRTQNAKKRELTTLLNQPVK